MNLIKNIIKATNFLEIIKDKIHKLKYLYNFLYGEVDKNKGEKSC